MKSKYFTIEEDGKNERINPPHISKIFMEISFKDFLEQECSKYFLQNYITMKKEFNKQGLVGDLFDEVGKYLNVKTFVSLHKLLPTWEFLHTYFMFKPFSLEDYLVVASRYLQLGNDIPSLLLPNTKCISRYHAKDVGYIKSGYHLHSYENYIIIYKYVYDDSGYHYLRHASKDSREYHYDGNLFGLKYVLKNWITVHQRDSFDFVQFITKNEIKDITKIIEILSHFDNDNMFTHLMRIVEHYKSSNRG